MPRFVSIPSVVEGHPPVKRRDLIDVELFCGIHDGDSVSSRPSSAGPDDGLRGAGPGIARGPGRLTEWPERGPDLGGEQVWLLPGSEMAALVDFVEVGEGGIGAPGPRLRGPVDVVGEDRDA